MHDTYAWEFNTFPKINNSQPTSFLPARADLHNIFQNHTLSNIMSVLPGVKVHHCFPRKSLVNHQSLCLPSLQVSGLLIHQVNRQVWHPLAKSNVVSVQADIIVALVLPATGVSAVSPEVAVVVAIAVGLPDSPRSPSSHESAYVKDRQL